MDEEGSMRNAKLEVCAKNAPLGSRSVAERLATIRPGTEIRQWACLGPCEHCARRPFLVVNGVSYVVADDTKALYEQVCEVLGEA